MVRDITIGQYYPGESLLHRADPRVKIILTLVHMVAVFIVNSLGGFAMFAVFTIIVVVVSHIPLKYTLKGLRPVLFIIIFATLINLFTIKGTPLFEYRFISISYEGVETAVKTALRLMLLVVGASLLTFTTTPILLTDGIEKLMQPLKRIGIPAHEIAMMMTIALRFIPTLLEETDKIIKAQSARGADFDTGNLLQRAKSYIPVLVPLFVSAFRRADELAIAMEARCYRGGEGRTRMKQLKLTSADFVVTSIMAVFVTAVLLLEFSYFA
jgi:energy-coupling factor transport system permease protein